MTTITNESRTGSTRPALVHKGALLRLGLGALAIIGSAGIANAAPVDVTNPGFEYPSGPDGVLDNVLDGSDASVGWVKSGGGQIYNPGNNANAPEGSNSYLILEGIGGFDLGTGSILQELDDALAEGAYTLSVEVGENATAASSFGSGYQVQLGVMDGATFVPLVTDDSTLAPSNGFLTSTVDYTAEALDTNLGLPLAIKLTGTVTAGSNNQVLFDDVRLDFVAAPGNREAFLKAQPFNKSLPGGGTVAMWGFAECTDVTYSDCADPADTDAPGPQIDAFAGFDLTINVKNTLPMPVSIMIPGQINAGLLSAPAGAGRTSFAAEIAAGGMDSYSFTNLKAGTYIYQSATYPSVQVPMGLYGAVIVQNSATEAYSGISAASETLMLFSEVDPIQNNRVDSYATATPGNDCVPLDEYLNLMTAGMPCTIDYNPMYFFVNGEAAAELPAGEQGDTALLRMANAGLRSHTPAIVGVEFNLIAEDGNLYPISQQQSAALLAAGKTLDALITLPSTDVTLQLFDRMPTFSNENLPNGGAIGGLVVGAGSIDMPPAASLAKNDSYSVPEDANPYISTGSVLDNDSGLTSAIVVGGGTSHGSLNLATDGTFTYTPDPDYSGPDSFTYSADTHLAQVTLNVSFENDTPVAAPDGPYFNGTGDTITVPAPGILGNDADADGDQLTAVIEGATPAGLTLNADGSLSYTVAAAEAPSMASFQYTACDGTVCSAPVNVTLNHNPVSGIVLTVKDENGVAVDGYRWLVEEDATWQPDPTDLPPPLETFATSFHKSHIPVVAQGMGAAEFAEVALDPAKHYYVSVLPLDAADGDGHTIGGSRIMPGDDAVTVQVNSHPLPTAQISIFVFEDNSPTNGAVDGNEIGLGGFQVTLEDAGGRYGIAAGTMSQDAFGQPLTNSLDCFGGSPPAPGIILSCPDTPENQAAGVVGEVLIKNLYQGKYGVIVSPPLSATEGWKQTSTIEGSKVIDAWVKAGEPPFFQEFGPAGWHVWVGFVSPSGTEAAKMAAAGAGPTNSVTGNVTNLHMSRPPDQSLWSSTNYDALGHTQAWVGINSANGTGPNYAAVEVDGNGAFTIDGLPDGDYQIVVWDAYLDIVIGYKNVTALTGGEARDVEDVPVFQWFTRSEHFVFLDDGCGDPLLAGDGIRQECELGIPEQNVNLRWRDGTVFQAFPTDSEGFAPFDQTFPFFHWQVFEVDYARFKPTGATITVDNGGDVSSTGYVLSPQEQVADCTTPDCESRTETGPVLTQGYQGFLGQTSTIDWGKMPYAEDENGGISGIVYYSSTRAENNPQLGVGEPWEPGIPGVSVRLYRQVMKAATEIAVENASFEIPVQMTSGVIDDVVDGTYGWVKTGGGQIFNPGLDANAPHGFNSYLILNDIPGYNLGSGTVQQTLADFLAEGTYTLTVQVGENATATSSFGNYRVQLGVLDGSEFVLLAEDANSLAPVDEFLTSTVQYTADVDDANIGLPLVIRLVGDVDGTGNIQVLFDDVHLMWSDNGLALVAETQTDSWDASLPEGCPGAHPDDLQIVGPGANGNDKCYDGLRNFNQIRPAVFDGGYAFGTEGELKPGKYVVEVVVPPGYELVKEEDVNVGFGDTYYMDPAGVTFPGGAVGALPDYAMVEEALLLPGLAQPPCVGELRTVPMDLSLFPETAPFADAQRPLCDRKEVLLSDQGQAAADFFLFTSTPITGRFAGMILDDTAQEFNPLSPQFGEKWAPPFVPVAVLDHLGNEISRVYSDQWGRMNGLVPSTFTANMPSPSGFAPAMLMTCMNDPGPIPDPTATPGTLMLDPEYNPAYSTFCYTFQYMPGTTTYLDTPVVPVSAFASGYNPPDCEAQEYTPKISRVDGAGGVNSGPLTDRGETLTIHSQATTTIPNPAYEGPVATPTVPKTATRNFGFGGTAGVVTLDGDPLDPADIQWTNDTITWTVPGNFQRGSYQLQVTNADGASTTDAITVEVRSLSQPVIRVPGDHSTIQAAIDAADENDLILVAPGKYEELVIMWKPVRLQGAGAGSTFLNGVKRPTEKIVNWRAKMDCLFGIGGGCTQVVDALPNQPLGAAGFDTEEGAAITVLGDAGGNFNMARVDGFSITGGDTGGGIFVNGYAGRLQISNNRVFGNSGSYHGGIRVGRPFLQLPETGPYAFNREVSIHHNSIVNNGGLEGAGGGLSLMAGTDDYSVTDNFVCGNFTLGDGGGIGHLGLSDGGVIANNRILFNQSFNQGQLVSGGGVFIGGEPAAVGAVTYGAGDVTVDSNLIQGNQAAGGHGGGVRTQYVNGQDALSGGLASWHAISIINNMIVNNSTAGSGAGISMQDTLISEVFNNTVAHNDSTATLGGLITVNPDGSASSEAQPSGIATQTHSPELANALPTNGPAASLPSFSNPELVNNVVWQNRAFYYFADEANGARLMPMLTQVNVGDCDTGGAYYEDLGVVGGAGMLSPTSSVLTDPTAYDDSNIGGDPAFEAPYCNGARGEPGPMFALPALDEGGNAWIEVRFGPLAPTGDYHITDISSGIDNADDGLVDTDFDGDSRPQGAGDDIGADEFVPPAP
ncbi:MAG: Ig-like domain-containing protein [Woeseiaceae bacterium]